jgi:hypothetical protein
MFLGVCSDVTCRALSATAVIFEHLPSLPVSDGAITLNIRVGDVWTLSTITNATKAVIPAPPPRAPFPAPYASDFESVLPPRAPPLWSDQGGVFEAWDSGDAQHGITLRQSVPTHPISWGSLLAATNGSGPSRMQVSSSPLHESSDGITPHTIFGDGRWNDVNITAAFMIEPGGGADPAAGTPGAMVGARASGNINSMAGVWFSVNASGGWNVSLSSGTIARPGVQLASGPCAAAVPGTWHVLSLNVSGGTATGTLDGVMLFSGLDVTGNGTASRAGWAALGTTDFGYVQFDNVFINGAISNSSFCDLSAAPPLVSPVNVSAWRCDDVSASAGGSFDWILAPGANATLYGPPGQLVLRGGDPSQPLCLANTVQAPDGWPLVQLVNCSQASLPPLQQLWVVRRDNGIMSSIAWGPPGFYPCLAMDGDNWSFGPPTYARIFHCGPLSSAMFNWDAVSGRISSEWLPDLCLAACARASGATA